MKLKSPNYKPCRKLKFKFFLIIFHLFQIQQVRNLAYGPNLTLSSLGTKVGINIFEIRPVTSANVKFFFFQILGRMLTTYNILSFISFL